jgi:hypothetical protein
MAKTRIVGMSQKVNKNAMLWSKLETLSFVAAGKVCLNKPWREGKGREHSYLLYLKQGMVLELTSCCVIETRFRSSTSTICPWYYSRLLHEYDALHTGHLASRRKPQFYSPHAKRDSKRLGVKWAVSRPKLQPTHHFFVLSVLGPSNSRPEYTDHVPAKNAAMLTGNLESRRDSF